MDVLRMRNNKKRTFKKFGINNIPTDLSNVLDNYNHKEYVLNYREFTIQINQIIKNILKH